MTTIWWIRQDLRLMDNPALHWAAQSGAVLPLYILPECGGSREPGGAQKWWLHRSLEKLRARIPLVLRRGEAREVIPRVVAETRARAVVWNRCFEPWALHRDGEMKMLLSDMGVIARGFNGSVLFEPLTLQNKSGGPFKVFTPFWRHCLTQSAGDPLPAPENVEWVKAVASDKLESWGLLPTRPNWAARFEREWAPGEEGARARLRDLLRHRLKEYAEARDFPALDNTSHLSPHLHFGEVSPREVFSAVKNAGGPGGEKFLSELGWREFSHHLLFHFPKIVSENWKPEFDLFPWVENEEWLHAWQHGKTGYPFVDAGMRELWATGYMHNRVRMVVASFLIKHLRTHWRLGEMWFWDTLLDADTACNVCGWQWVTGSGADAAPYFRIFNPVEQGRKFDPDGVYVRKWLPELAGLPNAFIHAPWQADGGTLSRAGVQLGETYPLPVVDHAQARAAALEGYKKVTGRDAGEEIEE